MVHLLDIENYAKENNIPIMQKDGIEFLTNYIKEHDVKKILEIGCAIGYSAIRMCLVHDDISVVTVERDESRYKEAIKNIKEMNLTNTINVFIGNAVEILPTFKEKYDIIFIDAAKGKYPIFLKEAIRLSHKNSIILADNILYKGYVMSDYNKHKQRTAVTHLREYIKEATENEKLETEILEVGDGLAISKVKEAIQ